MNQNSEEGLRDLNQILQVDQIESVLRVGDVYSLMIEYHANRQRWKQAYSVLQEMRGTIPESSIKFYVNPKLLMAIHKELGIEYRPPASSNRPQTAASSNDMGDDIRDNVDYGTYDD